MKMRRDKYRLVKISYLSRGKIGKTGKYRGNGKIRKNKKIEERLFLQNSTLSKKKKKKMNELYQIRQRLALHSSMARAIFCPFATSGFFVTTSLEWSCRWCSSTRSFITKQPFVIASYVKIKDYTRTFITGKLWNSKIA